MKEKNRRRIIMTNYTKRTISITFNWDDGPEQDTVAIFAPSDITNEQIYEKIIDAHNYLSFDDETDIYGTDGRNYETLLTYVCKENHWMWEEFECDMEMELD